MIALALASLLAALDDATTATLVFDRMHCDECKSELEANLKKMAGVKSVTFGENSAVVTVDEKSPVPAFTGIPKDLKLHAITLAIRGTVSFAGDRATFVTRGGATYALANERSKDTVGDLKKKLGGKNRFQITGILVPGNAIHLSAFQATDWKN
jgi:cation transport ATPase